MVVQENNNKMEKQTVFIKRYPSKGELPKVSRKYFTNYGYSDYSVKTNEWCDEYWLELDVEWFLEEIELPREEDVENYGRDEYWYTNMGETLEPFINGANFILNHLKSNTNETDKI